MFVSIEGITSSGKSSIITHILSLQPKAVVIHWKSLFDQYENTSIPHHGIVDGMTALSVVASYRYKVQLEITQALDEGKLVLIESYYTWMIAQSALTGFSPKWCEANTEFIRKPDLIIYLHVDVEVTNLRLTPKGFDSHQERKMQMIFEQQYQQSSNNTIRIVCGTKTIPTITAMILDKLRKRKRRIDDV